MRRMPVIAAIFSLFISCPSFAQGWIEFASQQDYFTINFPGEPDVRDITYDTEYFVTLPGRIYSREVGPNRYSVTVIDFTNSAHRHAERAAECRASGGDGDSCNDRTATELRSAIDFATWDLLNRDAKLTHFVYTQADRVEGNSLQLDNADGTRTYASVYMHEDRLYILDGTVPVNAVPPALFQQSMGFLDEEGKSIRYSSTYTNGFPAPPRAR